MRAGLPTHRVGCSKSRTDGSGRKVAASDSGKLPSYRMSHDSQWARVARLSSRSSLTLGPVHDGQRSSQTICSAPARVAARNPSKARSVHCSCWPKRRMLPLRST